ncbi:MAG TPA: DUF488 domain-containing protein [Ktedonobacteraceae bacterium]|nr:DUF488 domain-containing protein [Ktedonobacteraceae bacterium]
MTRSALHIAIKRAYDPPEPADGKRVLVDRLWPRGLSKERAHIDLWLKDLAPSNELRKWYGHDPEKFEEFRRRYEAELSNKQDALEQLRETARHEPVTLVFSAHDAEHSNAAVLLDVLKR